MSGPRYTVEYMGAKASGDDGGRSEPAFIRQFKQRAGLLPDAKLADKFASSNGSDAGKSGLGKPGPAGDEGDCGGREPAARSEEEMPQIVVTPGSGVSEAELAAVQARIREAGEEAKFDEARSRVRFVRSTIGGGGGGTGSRKSKAEAAVIGAGNFSKADDSAATEAKRQRTAADSASGSAKPGVCNKMLLSFDDEEGDDD